MLGPLEVVRDGDPVALGPAKQRAVLAVLLVHANTTVSTDRLVDEVWAEGPPEHAGHALHVYVSNLRKLLEPGRPAGTADGVITTHHPGYRLTVADANLDAVMFETMVTEAQRTLASGDSRAGAESLRAALKLWRGPALAGIDCPCCTREAARLEEARMAATMDRIDADLAIGRHASLIAELDMLTRDHPLDERLWSQLVLALYRSGRQADALAAYERVRVLLREELGLDPGPRLRDTHEAVLRQESRLELATDPPVSSAPVAPPAPVETVPETRRVVTALAADLTNVRALSERLDAGDAALIVGEALTRLSTAVEEMGGEVVESGQHGLAALFGAPEMHEDDPERAVRAALRIVEQVSAYGSEVATAWDVPAIQARVGVSTGPATVRDGEVAVTRTAATLRSAASPGTVLAARSTQHLVERLFEWGTPPEAYSAAVGPTPAVAVRRARTGVGKGRGLGGLEVELMGREAELATGTDALEALFVGIGGIVFVTGDAGVGKSRLLNELRRSFLRTTPGLWLEGRCLSYGERLPYWPFRELLRGWLGTSAQQPELRIRITLRRQLAQLFGDRASDLHPQLAAVLGLGLEPDAANRINQYSPAALQHATFEAVRALLQRLAGDRPVVLALDDLHWADANSLQLLERLLPLTDDAAVLLIMTQRPERDHASWRLQELATRTLPYRTRHIALQALSVEGSEALLTALVGSGTLPDSLSNRLIHTAEGNPFYIEELVRSLVAAQALVPAGHGWRYDHEAPVEIPPTVELVIGSRIDRLPSRCQQVLSAAAVLGREFSLDLLAAVTDDDPALSAHLLQLQRHDLLREARRWPRPEYVFKHVLTLETAYRRLADDRRRQLHRRAARALETRFPDRLAESSGVLARHYQEAGDVGRAVTYHHLAADAAHSMYALDAALEHYSAGLELAESATSMPAAEVIGRLRLGRGAVWRYRGDFESAESDSATALAQARAAGDETVEHLALHDLGLLRMYTGQREEATAYLRQAAAVAARCGDRVSQARAVSRIAVERVHQLKFDEALLESDRALAVARAAGDSRALALALDCRKLVALLLGDASTLGELFRELEPILRAHEELWYLQFALAESAFERAAAGDWSEAGARMHEALDINHRIGSRGEEPLVRALYGWLLHLNGDQELALEQAQEAAEQAEQRGSDWFIAWTRMTLGVIELDLDRPRAAAGHLWAGLTAAARRDERTVLLRCTSNLAWARWLSDQRGEAFALLRRSEDLLSQMQLPAGMAYLFGADAYVAMARVLSACGRPGAARAILVPLRAVAKAAGWQRLLPRGADMDAP